MPGGPRATYAHGGNFSIFEEDVLSTLGAVRRWRHLHAVTLRRRGLPRQFSSTARGRNGRRVEGQMFGAECGVAIKRGIAGGGSERECREGGFSQWDLALRNKEGLLSW